VHPDRPPPDAGSVPQRADAVAPGPEVLDDLARRIEALRQQLAAFEKTLAAATAPLRPKPRLRWLRGGLWRSR